MNRQNRKQRQRKYARLNIVAKYFRAGLSYRQIALKVFEETGFKPSKSAICRDVKTLFLEWRAWKLSTTEDLTALELERIDLAINVLWREWDRSKALNSIISTKKRGIAPDISTSEGDNPLKGIEIHDNHQVKESLGDVRYITEIRRQLQDRRKLLGLYSADKAESKTYILSLNKHRFGY